MYWKKKESLTFSTYSYNHQCQVKYYYLLFLDDLCNNGCLNTGQIEDKKQTLKCFSMSYWFLTNGVTGTSLQKKNIVATEKPVYDC